MQSVQRVRRLEELAVATGRAPVTVLLGPRQCGKSTLSRAFGEPRGARFFDLESEADRRQLFNPELTLSSAAGLVVLDEIQAMPELFNVLRVVSDKSSRRGRFLALGSAAPDIVRNVSESLAGRAEFIELGGFELGEVGAEHLEHLWMRGAFPPSFLASNEDDAEAWRQNFVRTFLERDIPQLGISIPAPSMRRFWTMLAHFHGRTWNASALARAMSVSDKTVRSYLDLLSGTFMVRQLLPWFENTKKRQVKAPKIYLRDTGVLHTLLSLPDRDAVMGHPIVGPSWEGFALEQILRALEKTDAYYWATHSGAEVDLFIEHRGRRYGFEIKLSESPAITRSMHTAFDLLRLDHLWIVHPGAGKYEADRGITVWPLSDVTSLPAEL